MVSLVDDMMNFGGNISNINNQLKQLSLSNTSSILSQTYTVGTNLLNTLSQVPNGTKGQLMGNYTYTYFSLSANSTFPGLLGGADHGLGTRHGAMN
jgi:methyltransferase-like protein